VNLGVVTIENKGSHFEVTNERGDLKVKVVYHNAKQVSVMPMSGRDNFLFKWSDPDTVAEIATLIVEAVEELRPNADAK
jgi:hypothetical protein